MTIEKEFKVIVTSKDGGSEILAVKFMAPPKYIQMIPVLKEVLDSHSARYERDDFFKVIKDDGSTCITKTPISGLEQLYDATQV